MDVLAALIWSCAVGLAIGNYATSFVYRLPKGESAFTKHPYCGGCGTMLAVKDLYPAVSWLLLRGRCRSCRMEIPAVYFWTEILTALVFMAAVLGLGFSERYLLVVAGGTGIVTLWALEARSRKVFHSVLLAVAALGIISRTLEDATIYGALYGICVGAGVPMVWWRLSLAKDNLNGAKERLKIPESIALGATAGAWLASAGLLVFVLLWGSVHLLYRAVEKQLPTSATRLQTVPFALALLPLITFPSLLAWLENLVFRGW